MDANKVTNVVIAGLGGQGVIRAANILAETAFKSGYDVKQGEIHGMSQRGGSVTSDVRFGKKVYSPMVPVGEADYVLVLEPSQEDNNRFYLADHGLLLSIGRFLNDAADVSALDHDDTPVTARNCNVALLGVLSGHLSFDDGQWEAAIRVNLPEKAHDENIRVFHYGKTLA
ncbi:MAG TPA: pyruvate ferredoxin oxidoreductase [Candidatus Hydrogenedentes bacterium]|nr:pyruvate ferredoxin oxidoreductase [Candidatus Hydrogenedentota bacterium]